MDGMILANSNSCRFLAYVLLSGAVLRYRTSSPPSFLELGWERLDYLLVEPLFFMQDRAELPIQDKKGQFISADPFGTLARNVG